MLRTRTPARRPGFTIVELMVSAAICVVIMTILATCFQISIDTMRHMRSTAEMADQLRAATTVIERDLAGSPDRPTEHFLAEPNKPNGGVQVSNQRLDLVGWTPPRGGFFRVRSFEPPATGREGADAIGISSSRSSGTLRSNGTLADGNLLHFTSVLSGQSEADFYYARVPAGTENKHRARAAEIAYFLDPVPRGRTTTGLDTFQLIRRQRLVGKTDIEASQLPSSSRGGVDDSAVIALKDAGGGNMQACTLADLVDQANRLGGANGTPLATTDAGASDASLAPLSKNPSRLGDDVLLSNVLSFEVKLIWTPGTGEPRPRLFATNTDNPFDTIQGASQAAGQNPAKVEFDTRPSPPFAVRVQAIQIRLRIWDPKLQAARQVTLVQDL